MKLLSLAFSSLLLPLPVAHGSSKDTLQRWVPSIVQVSSSKFPTSRTQSLQPTDKNQWLSASQNYTPVRATRVSLIKPEGFTEAKNFSGFQQDSTGASIVVTELPAPYSQIASGFTAENLKSRRMTLLSQKDITIDGRLGKLLQVTQVAYSTTFVKWIAVFGNETETVTIVASLPQEMEKTLSEPLRNAAVSAKWQKDKVLDPLANLNFAVSGTPSLKFTHRVQNTLLYTKNGVIPAKSLEDPFLVVGQAISDIEVTNQKQFSEQRIAQAEQIKNVSIDTSQKININGLSGYEIVARANDVKTNTP